MDRPGDLSTRGRVAEEIAILGPVGRWPWGPGTLAAALVSPVWLIGIAWPLWAALVVLTTFAGAAMSELAERTYGHDHGRIVIDELTGMMLTLMAVPHTPEGIVAAFIAFRFFDIVKPPPIRGLQDIPGGWGVMLDDLGAAAVAAVVLGAIFWFVG